MPKTEPRFLTVAQAAQFIGIHRQTVNDAIVKRKTLPAQKIGNAWLIKYEDAEYYKKFRSRKPGRPKNKQLSIPF